MHSNSRYREKRRRSASPKRRRSRDREPREQRRPPRDYIEHEEPSNAVILHGPDEFLTEQDIHDVVVGKMGASLEEIRLPRDAHTGLGRGFCFLKFTSVEHARQFHEKYFPEFELYGGWVRLNYCRNEGDGEDWLCLSCRGVNYGRREVCFRCGRSKPDKRPKLEESSAVNDGTNDSTRQPHNILIIWGLDALTDEDKIWSAFQMFPEPPTQVRLIRDRETHSSFGFAFLVFPSVAAAEKAYEKLNRDFFTIDTRMIQYSFAKPDCFRSRHHHVDETPSPDLEMDSIYHDQRAYYRPYPETSVAAPKLPAALMAEPVAQIAAEPEIDAEASAAAHLEDDLSAFYAELESVTEDQPTAEEPQTPADEGTSTEDEDEEVEEEIEKPKTDQDFEDVELMACLLCERQFPSLEKLKRHQERSDLHKTNMEAYLTKFNEELKAKKEKEAAMQLSTASKTAPKSKKRKQKRKSQSAFSNFYQRAQLHQGYITAEDARKLWEKQAGGEDESAIAPALQASVGSKLLAKMGWKEGEGLGRDAAGITKPVEASAYSRGAGIGAGKQMTATELSKKQSWKQVRLQSYARYNRE